MTIAIDGLSFSFGDKPVFDGLSFDLPIGSFTSVLGPSGAGKSTLLRLVGGLLSPTQGRVGIPDGPGRAVAMVFQDARLLPWRTVAGNLDVALAAAGVPAGERKARWAPLLDAVGLSHTVDHFPAALSGGMAQRVSVVRALSLAPRLLLLDEPFGAVDPLLRDQLQQTVSSLVREAGITTLLVTHDVTEAVVLSDAILIVAGQPASIRAQKPVALPFPRDPLAADTTQLAREVRDIYRATVSG